MQNNEAIENDLLLTLDAQEKVERNQEKEKKGISDVPEKRVSRKNPRIIYSSPFYQVLSELRIEGAPSVSTLNMGIIDKDHRLRRAILIQISHLFHNPLFKDFFLEGRHFSIDKIYRTSNRQHGYAPIHYTEIYHSKGAEKFIVVHVYLDGQGQQIYTQAKEIPSIQAKGTQQKSTQKELKLQVEQEELLQANISTSIGLIAFLFSERRERYFKEREKVDKLELELSEISRHLGHEEGLNNYIKKVKKIITALEDLNKYSEIRDSRIKYFSTVLVNLEKLFDEIQKTKKEAVLNLKSPSDSVMDETGAEESLSFEAASVPSKISQPAFSEQNIYDSLIKQIKELKNKLSEELDYSVKNLQKIKERQELCEKADALLIVVLLEFTDSRLKIKEGNESSKAITDEALTYIKQHREQGCKLLKEEALKGNLEGVKELFPLFGDKLEEGVYQELLDSLVYKKPTDNQKLIAICEFFNANSELYRNVVFKESRTKQYSLLGLQDLHKPSKPIGTTSSLLNFEQGTMTSLLYKVYHDENLAVFEMLLRHQADPNSWAGIPPHLPNLPREGNSKIWAAMNKSYHQTVKSYSIFNAISMNPNEDYSSYLKLLLRYNADPNLVLTEECMDSRNKEKLKLGRTLARHGKKPKELLQSCTNVASVEGISGLLLALLFKEFNTFKFILPYTSVKTIAYCFSKTLHNNNFNSIMHTGSSLSVRFADNKNMKKAAIDSPNKSFSLACIFFSSENQALEFNALKLMYKRLVSELEKMNQKEFRVFYEELYSRGSNSLCRLKDFNTAYYFFQGCQVSLLARCSTLKSQEEQLGLLKEYCPTLRDSLIKTLPYVFEKEELKARVEIYNVWINNIRQEYNAIKRKPKGSIEMQPSTELSGSERNKEAEYKKEVELYRMKKSFLDPEEEDSDEDRKEKIDNSIQQPRQIEPEKAVKKQSKIINFLKVFQIFKDLQKLGEFFSKSQQLTDMQQLINFHEQYKPLWDDWENKYDTKKVQQIKKSRDQMTLLVDGYKNKEIQAENLDKGGDKKGLRERLESVVEESRKREPASNPAYNRYPSSQLYLPSGQIARASKACLPAQQSSIHRSLLGREPCVSLLTNPRLLDVLSAAGNFESSEDPDKVVPIFSIKK